MFDVGFWELTLLGIVALIIIGPERLPGAAHTVGLWVGKGRRMLREVKADIDRELREHRVADLADLKKDIEDAGGQFQTAAKDLGESVDAKGVSDSLKESFREASPTGPTTPADGGKKKKDRRSRKKIAVKPEGTKSGAAKKSAGKKSAEMKQAGKKKTTKKPAKKSTDNHGNRNMNYYIYENWQAGPHKAVIHVGTCAFCNEGQGRAGNYDPKHAEWHGPFPTLEEARRRQASLNVKVKKECGLCMNRSLL